MARPGPVLAACPRPSTRSTDEVDELAERAQIASPSIDHSRRRRRRWPSRLSRAATLWTTIVYCWRSSSASANRNGSSSCSTELGERPVEGVDAERCGWRRRAPAFGSSLRGGREDGDASRTGSAGRPEAPVALTVLVGEADVGVVEEQQVLALHVEDQRLGVDRLGAEHARVEQGVEQERGVGGLGGDARDAADVDVRAAGAVEELEVEVQRLVVDDRARSGSLASIWSK